MQKRHINYMVICDQLIIGVRVKPNAPFFPPSQHFVVAKLLLANHKQSLKNLYYSILSSVHVYMDTDVSVRLLKDGLQLRLILLLLLHPSEHHALIIYELCGTQKIGTSQFQQQRV